MALRLVSDPKHEKRGSCLVAIDPKRKRLSMYKEARNMMIEEYGKEFEHVQLFVDDENKAKFWIKPCEENSAGSRKLDAASKSTRTLSISLLLQELDWLPEETMKLDIGWDKENEAGVVELPKSK